MSLIRRKKPHVNTLTAGLRNQTPTCNRRTTPCDPGEPGEPCVRLTCVRADVLDVVALAVGEVGTLAAGVQFAWEVVPQVFPPVVLTDRHVRT